MRLPLFILFLFSWFSGLTAGTPQKKIISLSPSITRSIYYLEGKDLLQGVTSYCFIAKDDNKEIVASAVKVNIEKVISLEPDLVVTTELTEPDVIMILEKAGIKTQVFKTPANFTELCGQFRHLGLLIGKEDVADRVINDVTRKVNQIKASYSQQNDTRRFFFQIGSNPLFTVLENTFMDDYIAFSGGENISAGLQRGIISREFVLKQNPDVILIVNMGMVAEEEKKMWYSYPDLNAVKNNNIFMIESDMASTPNPPDFLKTLEIIREHLNKGEKKKY